MEKNNTANKVLITLLEKLVEGTLGWESRSNLPNTMVQSSRGAEAVATLFTCLKLVTRI